MIIEGSPSWLTGDWCCSKAPPLLQSFVSPRVLQCQTQARLWHDITSLPTALHLLLCFSWPGWSAGISAVSAHPSTWLLQSRQGSSPRSAETPSPSPSTSVETVLYIFFSDYPELTNTLPGREGESEGFENGFFFPQPPSPPFPPSPNLFTEAPTPEFIGEKYNIYLLLGFSRLY